MNPTSSKPVFYRKLVAVYIGFLCLFQSHSGQSQNIERVFSEGFHNHVEELDRFSDGRWLISNVSSRIPGSQSNEDLYVTILDSTATLINQIRISLLPNEDFKIESSLVFPDGDFLVMYSVRNCDAGIHAYYAEKFDTAMQSVWHILLEGFEGFSNPFMAVSPDKNILFLLGENVGKMSADDGSIMWQTGYPFWGSAAYQAILDPGTENLILTEDGRIRLYEQKIDNGEVEYEYGLSVQYDNKIGYPDKLWAGSDSIFYILTSGTDKPLLRFHEDLHYDTLISLSSDVIDVTSSPEKIVVLKKRDHQQYEILLYDTSGILLETYVSPPSGLRPTMISADEDGIGVAGSYGSGPVWIHDTTYMYADRSQGWFRYFPGYALVDSASEVSVAITAIVQQDSIAIETYWTGPFQGYVHDFEGGDFQMEITNTGNEIVNSFWMNISYSEPVNFSFCNTVKANYVLIEDVSIQPGESFWYDFGDIFVTRQLSYPEEFCFWTSGPNFLPDFLPDDDVYCDEGIVSTNAIQDEYSFSIFPNPADEEINVTLAGNYLDDSEWVLVDILGRKIKLGNFESHSLEYRIEVGDVPAGIYYLNAAQLSNTIIIQHP